jgi:hypothetical protein
MTPQAGLSKTMQTKSEFIHFEDRASDHPFVERVWRCHSDRADTFFRLRLTTSRSPLRDRNTVRTNVQAVGVPPPSEGFQLSPILNFSVLHGKSTGQNSIFRFDPVDYINKLFGDKISETHAPPRICLASMHSRIKITLMLR